MDCSAKLEREEFYRQFIEQFYQKSFPEFKPDFLCYPSTNENLGLTGYNKELKIGFDYRKIHHYSYPNVTHNNQKEFRQEVEKDQFKEKACDEAGIHLIVIPYTVPEGEIKQFISQRLPQ